MVIWECFVNWSVRWLAHLVFFCRMYAWHVTYQIFFWNMLGTEHTSYFISCSKAFRALFSTCVAPQTFSIHESDTRCWKADAFERQRRNSQIIWMELKLNQYPMEVLVNLIQPKHHQKIQLLIHLWMHILQLI